MKPIANSKELNAMIAYQFQQQSVLQSPNGLSSSHHNNLISSNNKILKGSDYQTNPPAQSMNDFNSKNNAGSHPTIANKYDPNKKPPLIQIAQEHSQSTMVGINKKHVAKPELLKVCPCCQRQIEKTQFSLNCELSKMSFLGTGVPLYFHVMKLCLFIAFVHMSSSSGYQIVSNQQGNNCVTQLSGTPQSISTLSQSQIYNNCYKNWITESSLGNNLNNSSNVEIQSILGTISIFLMILAVHYYRGIARKVAIDVDQDIKHVSIADYSIMITGIDRQIVTINFAETIKSYFENNLQVHLLDRCLKVESVDLCFDITSQKRLQVQRNGLEKQINAITSLMIIPDKVQKKLDELEKQLDLINKEMQDFEIHAAQRDIKFYQKYFLGKAFVSFSTINEKELLLQQYQIPPDYKLWGSSSQVEFYPGASKVDISQAPHPKEVHWENLYLSADQYFKKSTAGLIYCCLITINKKLKDILGFVLLIYFLFNQYSFFFLIIMAFLLVQYFFLEQDVSNFADNDTNLTLAMSLCVAFLIPLLNKLLSFLHTLISLFDVDSRASVWKRSAIEQCSSHTQINLTQNKLNKLFELPEMDFMDGYGSAITILCSGLFNSILIPVGVPFAFCGLLLKYWTDKYIFIRRRACINYQNHFLSFLMIDLLEYIIIIYSLGNLIFLFYAQSDFLPYASLAGVVLSVINKLLPSDIISSKLFSQEKRETTQIPYQIAKSKFPDTYHSINPASLLFSSARKTSNNQIKRKRNGDDTDNINKSGSRSHIKQQEELNRTADKHNNRLQQLDDKNEIISLTMIMNSPEQNKSGYRIDQENSRVLQNSSSKHNNINNTNNNNNLQGQTSKRNGDEAQNKNIKNSPIGQKSLPMIQNHNIYNNNNKENFPKTQNGISEGLGGQLLKNGSHMNQSMSSIDRNSHIQIQSYTHMKQKDFQQMQQKIKGHDDSAIEEPDMYHSPLKQRVK